ncbi:hypothetical protein Tco_0319924 [Tanacetum coccineum]
MNCILEIAKDAKVIEIDDQLLVLIKRQVETELMLEGKFRDLYEEISNFVKEIKDVVKEVERLSCKDVAKETVHLFRRRQKRELYKMTRLHIMVNESHLSVREKHTFGSAFHFMILERPELVEVKKNEKVTIAKENLKEARSRQKSYVDRYQRALEFKPKDHVFLKEDLYFVEEPKAILDKSESMRNKTSVLLKFLIESFREGAYGCILGSKHVACFRHLFRARWAFLYVLLDYLFRSVLMIYEISDSISFTLYV